MPFTKGYSTGVPRVRAKAMNCAGASAWSRKKMTWCSRNTARMRATSFDASSRERSTPRISAPSAPAMRRTSKVYCSTLMLALRMTVP